MLDDADFPAYTMGRAADLIGVTPAFLRSLGTAGLIEPERSLGGHRRYSRHQLQLASRVRQLLDEGMLLTAACRIVTLEDRLEAAHRRILDLGGTLTPDDNADVPIPTHLDIAAPKYYPSPRTTRSPSAL
ncbi:MerR family transcriptional regulator [Actinoplanes sp. N902-109]|uniref:MerR family transcriptional regulator n=1 Tax=Actinoplanes sp. (strain N902-109) TaxID=649831 RepID=UPI00350EBEE8